MTTGTELMNKALEQPRLDVALDEIMRAMYDHAKTDRMKQLYGDAGSNGNEPSLDATTRARVEATIRRLVNIPI